MIIIRIKSFQQCLQTVSKSFQTINTLTTAKINLLKTDLSLLRQLIGLIGFCRNSLKKIDKPMLNTEINNFSGRDNIFRLWGFFCQIACMRNIIVDSASFCLSCVFLHFCKIWRKHFYEISFYPFLPFFLFLECSFKILYGKYTKTQFI